MTIGILTSKENFVWTSMQEIIPHIERTWVQYGQDLNHKIQTVSIDEIEINQVIKSLFHCEKIIVTCFTYKMTQVIRCLRFEMKVDIPFIFYVHNMATIAFWPYRYWVNENLFFESDIFISTCENDKLTVLSILPKAHVQIVPFFNSDYDSAIENKPKVIDSLLYIGRISPQKNLHSIIYAYSIAKKNIQKLPPLVFFGKEDHLGSPNCGIACTDYQAFLKNLVHQLDLTADVHFAGFVERVEIQKKLTKKSYLVISASLHSDENFGMAILQSLMTRNFCILSDWGGSSDFKKYFMDQVYLISTKNGPLGPHINCEELAIAIIACLHSVTEISHIKSDYYTQKFLNTRFADCLSIASSSKELQFSKLAEDIYAQKKLIFPGSINQIFYSFNDPLFVQISNFYRGSFSKIVTRKNLQQLPWVNFETDAIVIKDPQKGLHKYKKTGSSVSYLKKCGYL